MATKKKHAARKDGLKRSRRHLYIADDTYELIRRTAAEIGVAQGALIEYLTDKHLRTLAKELKGGKD